jgi:hypothetical protein
MADKKISQLTAATTPLAGTEVLPIVQGGTTVKATVNNVLAPIQVTATRAGINTTPTFSFHILGSGEFGGLLAQSNVAGATSFTLQQGVTGVSNSGVSLRNADSAYDWLRFTAVGGDVTVNTGNLVVGTAGKGVTTGGATALGLGVNGSVTAVTINASSNVGVGTASPASKFNVVGDQIIVGSADGTDVLGVQIKGTSLGAIPAGQVQGYIATGNSSIGIAGDLLIACRTDVAAGVRIITGTTPTERVIVNGSGNVGVGTSSPDAAAILDVQSTTKGVRFPNMTTAQKTAITPAAGTVVFDTTLAKLCVYSGAAWQTITSV